MKKGILAALVICSGFAASCSSDDGPSPSGSVDQSQLTGWWYPNEENGLDYRGRFFGEDNEYKQDQTNYGLGMGIGTYEWVAETDTIAITPISGFYGGVAKFGVSKLSQDSLVFNYMGSYYRYSRTEPN